MIRIGLICSSSRGPVFNPGLGVSLGLFAAGLILAPGAWSDDESVRAQVVVADRSDVVLPNVITLTESSPTACVSGHCIYRIHAPSGRFTHAGTITSVAPGANSRTLVVRAGL